MLRTPQSPGIVPRRADPEKAKAHKVKKSLDKLAATNYNN